MPKNVETIWRFEVDGLYDVVALDDVSKVSRFAINF